MITVNISERRTKPFPSTFKNYIYIFENLL